MLQFYQGWIGAVACRCFPHPTLSLASGQTLKDLKRFQRHQVEVRRVNLANWALRTSPKFTTSVKYQSHQGVWPDQRSGNSNHHSPPHTQKHTHIVYIYIFQMKLWQKIYIYREIHTWNYYIGCLLKPLQKNVECFTLKPNAHSTYWNLHIKLIKILISQKYNENKE